MFAVKSAHLSLTWHLGDRSMLKHENGTLKLKHFLFLSFFTPSNKIYALAIESLFRPETNSDLWNMFNIF